jgi:hypothetical protein
LASCFDRFFSFFPFFFEKPQFFLKKNFHKKVLLTKNPKKVEFRRSRRNSRQISECPGGVASSFSACAAPKHRFFRAAPAAAVVDRRG